MLLVFICEAALTGLWGVEQHYAGQLGSDSLTALPLLKLCQRTHTQLGAFALRACWSGRGARGEEDVFLTDPSGWAPLQKCELQENKEVVSFNFPEECLAKTGTR